MASETKVGLLAGLAFIVCFAVILANRGRHEPISPHLLQLIDDSTGVPRSPKPQIRSSLPGGNVTEVAQDRSAPRSDAPWSERPDPARVDRDAHGPVNPVRSEGVTVRHPSQNPQQAWQHIPHASRSDTPLEPMNPTNGVGATFSPSSHQVQEASARRAVLEKRLDELTATLAPQTRSSADPTAEGDEAGINERATGFSLRGSAAGGRGLEPAVNPRGLKPAARQSPAMAQVRYKVQAGDTLSKIAHTHYHSRSRRIINAIFDANRSLLASPDEIRVGMELSLPTIEGVGSATAVTPSGDSEASERAAGFSPRGSAEDRDGAEPAAPPRGLKPAARRDDRFRWYQIQKNDRYVSIAREQLGDESRWREIYELNKDKFPDPGRIREGVRIKLPRAEVAVSGKGRS